MATLHGFPILLAGQRMCIVEMPDCWAIMNSLDSFPQASFRFQKDDAGWREAVAQLSRSDAPDPNATNVPSKRKAVVVNPVLITNNRRQFAISRFGICLTGIALALTVRLPWAVIHHGTTVYKGDLFAIMSHGWRKNMAYALIAVGAFAAVQALAFPFKRIRLFSSISGFVALVFVLMSMTQIHTYVSPKHFPNPDVSVGYGAYAALGLCLVLIMAWAIYPTRMRRSKHAAVDPLGQYGSVDDFTGAGTLSGYGGANSGGSPAGVTLAAGAAATGQPPPPSGRYVKQAQSPPAQPGGPTQLEGLPSLGAALTELAQQNRTAPGTAAQQQAAKASGQSGGATWTPPPSVQQAAASSSSRQPAYAGRPVSGPAGVPPPPQVQSPPEVRQPAGWYADYADPAYLRWWDGAQWSEHTHPVGAG